MAQSTTRRNTTQNRNRGNNTQALTAENVMEQTKRSSQHMVEAMLDCARERPGATILWSLGIGFVLGWRLKPW